MTRVVSTVSGAKLHAVSDSARMKSGAYAICGKWIQIASEWVGAMPTCRGCARRWDAAQEERAS